MTITEHVGNRIRMYRKHRGLTLTELAEKLNYSSSTISKYENGLISIDIEILYKIADALEISINRLIDYKMDEKAISTHRKHESFFERTELFYFYQYFIPEKKVYTSVLEINRNTDKEDSCIIYYDIPSVKEYGCSSYIYHGTISYYDTVTTIRAQNPYNRCDELFIYAKIPFTTKPTTPALVLGLSSSRRTPYSYKILFSTTPLKIDTELITELCCTGKDILTDIKRSNALYIY